MLPTGVLPNFVAEISPHARQTPRGKTPCARGGDRGRQSAAQTSSVAAGHTARQLYPTMMFTVAPQHRSSSTIRQVQTGQSGQISVGDGHHMRLHVYGATRLGMKIIPRSFGSSRARPRSGPWFGSAGAWWPGGTYVLGLRPGGGVALDVLSKAWRRADARRLGPGLGWQRAGPAPAWRACARTVPCRIFPDLRRSAGRIEKILDHGGRYHDRRDPRS
jgi:hypothetical protein